MKTPIVALLTCILGYIPLTAQTDFPITQPLEIGESNTLDITPSNFGTLLRMPSVLDEPLLPKADKPSVNMLPDQELLQAGHDLQLDPKIREKQQQGGIAYFGDQYLGDVKTTAQFVGIVCRDHEYVDGDRIKIYLNGEVVAFNLLLAATFKGINVDLVPGFNRIEFEALNQGSSGPNTAQVTVTDDTGKVIHNNRWNLSTGSRASLILVKEEE